jgi:hypothetical protein
MPCVSFPPPKNTLITSRKEISKGPKLIPIKINIIEKKRLRIMKYFLRLL